MIPAPFDYHRPRSVDEMIALLAQHGEEARIVAGGHSLILMMRFDWRDRGTSWTCRICMSCAAPGANPVSSSSQHEMIGSELLAASCPIFRETSQQIGDPQVRYCGTLGGNVANGDPGNDMPAVMIALDATYRVKGPHGERDVAARDFYHGIYSTPLEQGEILLSVRIPTPAEGHG